MHFESAGVHYTQHTQLVLVRPKCTSVQALVLVYGRVHVRRWWLGKCRVRGPKRRGDFLNAARDSMALLTAVECVVVELVAV